MRKFLTLITLVSTTLTLQGCTSKPTAGNSVVDNRPYITLEATTPNDIIILDGIDIGHANDLFPDKSALKIESGIHLLEVQRNGFTVLKTKFYISSGTSKSFSIPVSE